MAEWPEQTDNTLSNPEIGLKSDWWMLLGSASQRVTDNGVDPVATLVPGVGQSSTQLNSTQLSGNTTSHTSRTPTRSEQNHHVHDVRRPHPRHHPKRDSHLFFLDQ